MQNLANCKMKVSKLLVIFSAPDNAHESASRTTINGCHVRLIVQFKVDLIIYLELYLKVHFSDLYEGAKKGTYEIALKSALQVAH